MKLSLGLQHSASRDTESPPLATPAPTSQQHSWPRTWWASWVARQRPQGRGPAGRTHVGSCGWRWRPPRRARSLQKALRPQSTCPPRQAPAPRPRHATGSGHPTGETLPPTGPNRGDSGAPGQARASGTLRSPRRCWTTGLGSPHGSRAPLPSPLLAGTPNPRQAPAAQSPFLQPWGGSDSH